MDNLKLELWSSVTYPILYGWSVDNTPRGGVADNGVGREGEPFAIDD